ncbi:MAG: HNH endonuclease [Planctomycetia bacterium]|nr:HNH endonuclease [Planctomycetia bacterium]
MSFDKRTYAAFIKRTHCIYHHQKKRAKDALDYQLPEFRQLVQQTLGAPCPYCDVALTVFNFSVDHVRPLSRGGSHAIGNLALCCERCNQIKGMMTDGEFCELIDMIRCWEPQVRTNLLARLRAGGKLIRHRT